MSSKITPAVACLATYPVVPDDPSVTRIGGIICHGLHSPDRNNARPDNIFLVKLNYWLNP